MNFPKIEKKSKKFGQIFWVCPKTYFSFGGQNDPQSRYIFQNFLRQKIFHNPTIILGSFPEDLYFDISTAQFWAKKSLKMPKIRFYVSPKIGENPVKTRVGRAEYEFCELKIAKKFQKHTPKLMF